MATLDSTTPTPRTFVAIAKRPAVPDRGKDHAIRYFVALDIRHKDGTVTTHYPLSPQSRRKAKALADLRAWRELYPAAYLTTVRFEAYA